MIHLSDVSLAVAVIKMGGFTRTLVFNSSASSGDLLAISYPEGAGFEIVHQEDISKRLRRYKRLNRRLLLIFCHCYGLNYITGCCFDSFW